MNDIVLLPERIKTSIGLGESHFREFKSALQGPLGHKTARDRKEIAKDICLTLVGFANADGGELLIGVEDNGEITGLPTELRPHLDYLLKVYIDGVHKTAPLQNVRALSLLFEEKEILYFAVPKSVSAIHQTSDGKCVQRRDLETIPISAEEIHFGRQERTSREYDREFVDGATPDSLNLLLVKALAEQISKGMTAEKCLQYLELADFNGRYLRLRRAALLLFATDPARWHPRLQIRILRVVGTELKSGAGYNVGSDTYAQGNVLTLIERAWDELRPHLVHTRLTGSAKFESRVMYPELACREALINAIAHRDYSQEGLGIEIYIYDDRLEIKNPGGLLSSLSVADLKRLEGAHQSRNSLVARVLREMGYMREVGEGMRRIFELMQSNELTEPEIESSGIAFSVTLRNRPLYSPEQIIWLESFSELSLSREEKGIIVLGYGGKLISPNDIWASLGLVDTERYRQLIHGLQLHGVLVTEVPKPKAQKIARSKKVNIRDIPRFRIVVPSSQPTAIALSHGASTARTEGKPSSGARSYRRARTRRATKEDGFSLSARIFVAKIPPNTSRETFLQFLRELAPNVDVYWPLSSQGRNNYAFGQFSSANDAKAALQAIDGRLYSGQKLVARPARTPAPSDTSRPAVDE